LAEDLGEHRAALGVVDDDDRHLTRTTVSGESDGPAAGGVNEVDLDAFLWPVQRGDVYRWWDGGK
jgi:hypothetical protein